MYNELEQEILFRIKIDPKFLKKVSKRKDLDLNLNFYRKAVSYNIDAYEYLPYEFKDDYVIVDLVLNGATTSHLNIPYNKIIPNNEAQMEELKKIKINYCYLLLYKIIFGKDKKFDEEVRLNSINNNNSVIAQINDILCCLDEDEMQYLIYRFGLKDGCYKCSSLSARYFKIDKSKIKKYEESIIVKVRKIISNSHLFSLGFYDEIESDKKRK